MTQDSGGNSGSRERSQSSLSPPVGFDPGRLEALEALTEGEPPWPEGTLCRQLQDERDRQRRLRDEQEATNGN